MGTNHFGHFLLTNLLLSLIKQTASTSANVRIVNVSSMAHEQATGIDLADVNREKSYSAWRVYQESKLANVLFTNELARKLEVSSLRICVSIFFPLCKMFCMII